MASMNNWLGFSLSPQEPPSQPDHHHHHHHHHQDQSHINTAASRLGFQSDEISSTDVSGECFDLTSDSTAPSLNLPAASFGILEAFRHSNQSQDWANINLDHMLMPTSCNTGHNLDHQDNQQPKLENFLGVGGHSFATHEHKFPPAAAACNTDYNTTGDYIFQSCSFNTPNNDHTTTITHGEDDNTTPDNIASNTSSIGLSMIKSWLRNQPAPPAPTHQQECNNSGGGGGAQSLSLSMSTGVGVNNGEANNNGAGGDHRSSPSDNNKTDLDSQTGAIEAVPRKSIDTFGQRTSIYRGVTRHRWTGRYEAHLWDNSCRREGQTRKGRQVYLGGYDKEEKAARAYDLAALKYWGTTTTTNFPISNYEKELEEMKHMTRQEYVASLRRKSSGFSRGASIYRGVTRHHQHGRWQARIGRVAGNKDLYLGTFSTQEEAAEAYDIAAIKFRGLNAVTNFDMNRYDVKSILESTTLPIGGAAKRLKDVDQAAEMAIDTHRSTENENILSNSQLTEHGIINSCGWPTVAFQQGHHHHNHRHQPFSMHYPYGQRLWCKQEQDTSTDGSSNGFQDHLHQQLQLGSSNTHNFFQPSVFHNLMSLDSSNSMDHNSAGSNNSVIYSTTAGGGGGGDANGSSYQGMSYAIPLATVLIANNNDNNNEGNGYNGENMYGSSLDAYQYHTRNLHYVSQQATSSSGGGGGGGGGGVVIRGSSSTSANDHQGSTCNNWVSTAVPALGAIRSNNMPFCHGAPTFCVWNDT